jgi:hypothetical protein
VAEAVADDDAQHSQVCTVFGKGVGGNEPAVLAQRRGDIEDGIGADVFPQGDSEHR